MMKMKVNVIHTDMNPCGGAEQLALATLQALVDMGMQVDLTVARAPDIPRIEKAFGDKVCDVFNRVRVKALGRLPVELDVQTGTLACKTTNDMQEYDVIVNTHGDLLPYAPSFPGRMITYCHFPVAANYYVQHNMEYLQNFVDLGLFDEKVLQAAAGDRFWQSLWGYYLLMMRNSLVATNSQYSRQAIMKVMECAGALCTPAVIAPPVYVEEFRQAALFSASRADSVLVVSRIHRSKKLENAVELARMLKQQGTGKKIVIAGNLSPADRFGREYHDYLLGMIERRGVSDYVEIKLNVELKELWSLMQKSKVYFHPLPGEPFGISVVEAMSAGLVPVVPDVGGPSEFVPKKYQFHSIEQASDIVRASLEATNKERLLLSDLVGGFSLQAYLGRFQQFVRSTLEPAEPSPTLVTLHKRQEGHV